MSSFRAGQQDQAAAVAGGGASAPGENDRTSLAARVLAAAPVLIAAAAMTSMGLWGLARYGAMGNDEVVSRWAARLPLHQLAHLLRHIDAVHGLYYLFLHAWMAVGTSPAVMRIPSVIAMIIGAVLIVLIARRLTASGWAGLLCGLIMAFTPFVSYYAQTARSYALVYACVLGATLVLLHALEAERHGRVHRLPDRRWLAYCGLMTLSAYLNEMALLVLVAHAVTVLVARYGRQVFWRWAGAGALSIVLVSPLLALSARQAGAVDWIPRPGLKDVVTLYHDYFGPSIVAAALLAVCAVAALLPATGAADRPRWRQGGWWRGGVSLPSVALPMLLVPAALLVIESRIGPPLYQDRYVLYGEAGAALLAGAGAYRAGRWLAAAAGGRRRWATCLPGIAICACALVLQFHHQENERKPFSRQFNFGGPSFFVAAHARQRDGVMFFGSFFRKARLGYPGDYRKTSDFALSVPPSVAHPYQGLNKPFAAVRPLMLGHQRIWVIGKRPSRRLGGALAQESAVLSRDFRRVLMRGYKGVWLTLWVHR